MLLNYDNLLVLSIIIRQMNCFVYSYKTYSQEISSHEAETQNDTVSSTPEDLSTKKAEAEEEKIASNSGNKDGAEPRADNTAQPGMVPEAVQNSANAATQTTASPMATKDINTGMYKIFMVHLINLFYSIFFKLYAYYNQ